MIASAEEAYVNVDVRGEVGRMVKSEEDAAWDEVALEADAEDAGGE